MGINVSDVHVTEDQGKRAKHKDIRHDVRRRPRKLERHISAEQAATAAAAYHPLFLALYVGSLHVLPSRMHISLQASINLASI